MLQGWGQPRRGHRCGQLKGPRGRGSCCSASRAATARGRTTGPPPLSSREDWEHALL